MAEYVLIHPRGRVLDDGSVVPEWYVETDGLGELVIAPTGANANDLRTKARQAVQANIDSIGQIPAAVTRVQGVIDGTASNLTQANAALDELAVVLRGLLNDYERMLRQLVAVERLIIGSDLLNETTGT